MGSGPADAPVLLESRCPTASPVRRPPLELKPGRLAEVLVASFELN